MTGRISIAVTDGQTEEIELSTGRFFYIGRSTFKIIGTPFMSMHTYLFQTDVQILIIDNGEVMHALVPK